MDPLQVVVVDDAPMVGAVLEKWLSDSTGQTFNGAEVYPYESVNGFCAEVIADPDYEVDLVVVDLVLEADGGLKILAELAKHRPQTPALIFSAMENSGDRFMYVAAAANWFGSETGPLKAILPKVFGAGRKGNLDGLFTQVVESVIAGSHTDRLLHLLRRDDNHNAFHQLLRTEDDLKKWQAIQRQGRQGPAARVAGVSDQTLRDWTLRRIGHLDQLWDSVITEWDNKEAFKIAGQEERFKLPENKHENNDTYAKLREFVYQQHAFFADNYLQEHFGSNPQ